MTIDFNKKALLKGAVVSYSDYVEKNLSELHKYNEKLKESWVVSEHLKNKVDNIGRLKPFYGDTIVYPLDIKSLKKIQQIQYHFQSKLDIFAESLNPTSFHITIHDLSNGPNEEDLLEKMNKNKKNCGPLFGKIKKHLLLHGDEEICFKSSLIYQSNNIALLVGFIPKSERDYLKIINLYNLFEEIIYLDYLPRFHVTLNYFKACCVCTKNAIKLKSLVDSYELEDIEIKMSIRDIVYQRFSSMNNYKDLIKF